MIMSIYDSLNPDIRNVELYKKNAFILRGYCLPFVVLYAIWIGYWINVLNFEDSFKLGIIVLALLGLIHILVCLFCHWSISFKCLMTCTRQTRVSLADCAKVVPTPNNGYTSLVSLMHEKSVLSGEIIHFFYFQRLKYFFLSDSKENLTPIQFPTNWKILEYLEWKGHNDAEIEAALEKYDTNHLHLTVPTFAELFKERATAPFFVFQVFCAFLWCLDQYWLYPMLTLTMLGLFEASLVQQQLKNLSEVRSMGSKPYGIMEG
ncbi:unnamed protein product [Protopolystoma xenopodis]|uniref:P5A-ATPase transmembrane helical hairpin domain-containing protein n=1 Tax=Protopolystoma xenopodis TaxID=117903 RepID=A0A3S5A2A9_9PLAT|nr:unnamed protein product [Protopolystoma xenopodis]